MPRNTSLHTVLALLALALVAGPGCRDDRSTTPTERAQIAPDAGAVDTGGPGDDETRAGLRIPLDDRHIGFIRLVRPGDRIALVGATRESPASIDPDAIRFDSGALEVASTDERSLTVLTSPEESARLEEILEAREVTPVWLSPGGEQIEREKPLEGRRRWHLPDRDGVAGESLESLLMDLEVLWKEREERLRPGEETKPRSCDRAFVEGVAELREEPHATDDAEDVRPAEASRRRLPEGTIAAPIRLDGPRALFDHLEVGTRFDLSAVFRGAPAPYVSIDILPALLVVAVSPEVETVLVAVTPLEAKLLAALPPADAPLHASLRGPGDLDIVPPVEKSFEEVLEDLEVLQLQRKRRLRRRKKRTGRSPSGPVIVSGDSSGSSDSIRALREARSDESARSAREEAPAPSRPALGAASTGRGGSASKGGPALAKARRPSLADDLQRSARNRRDDDDAADARSWKSSSLVSHAARIRVGDDATLPIEGMDVEARVDGFRARVVVDFFFRNPRDRRLLGDFEMRLPDGASPYYLAFGASRFELSELPGRAQRDGDSGASAGQMDAAQLTAARRASMIEPKVARMVPREKAERAFEETVRRRVDPALMEWGGAGVFRAQLFPIQSGRIHRVVLAYELDLTRRGDDFELQLAMPEGLERSHLTLDVATPAGIDAAVEPGAQRVSSGERSRYAFTDSAGEAVSLRLRGAGDLALSGGDETSQYFAAHIAPPLEREEVEASPGSVIFAVDVSMSSSGARYRIWRELMRQILTRNRDTIQSYAVLFFGVDRWWWREGFVDNTPENLERLMRDSGRIALEGATDVGGALDELAAPGWQGEWLDGYAAPRDVFLLGDGAATWGESDAGRLAARLRNGGVGSIFAYRTGIVGEETRLLERLAGRSGGAVFSVSGEDEVARAAVAHNQIPWRLEGVEVSGTDDIVVAGNPRHLYPGQHLVVAGRGDLGDQASIQLELRRGAERRTLAVPLDHTLASPLAPRAYGQIATGQLEGYLDHTARFAKAYARHFRVTGATHSLLMLESERDYRRFGIRPEDDASTVRQQAAAPLLASARGGDGGPVGQKSGRERLIERLRSLRTRDGVRLDVPELFVERLAALPEEHFEVRVPPLETELRGWGETPAAVREQLASGEPKYGPLAAEAARRLERHGAADALTVFSSLVEAHPGDGDLARDVGYATLGWGLPAHAYHLFERMARKRPDEPQSWRALARSLEVMGRPTLAMAHYEIAVSGRWHARFGDFGTIAGLDYANFLRRALETDALPEALVPYARLRLQHLQCRLGFERADLVVMLTWNTDATDIDLHVVEPTGETCYYKNQSTRIGGELTSDVTEGYGPEMYVLEEAPAGHYLVRAKYYDTDDSRVGALRTRIHATIVSQWGTERERVYRSSTLLEDADEVQDLAMLRRARPDGPLEPVEIDIDALEVPPWKP